MHDKHYHQYDSMGVFYTALWQHLNQLVDDDVRWFTSTPSRPYSARVEALATQYEALSVDVVEEELREQAEHDYHRTRELGKQLWGVRVQGLNGENTDQLVSSARAYTEYLSHEARRFGRLAAERFAE